MGWTETWYNRRLSHKEKRQEMDRLLTWESGRVTHSVVKSTIKNNVYYAAVKEFDTKTGEGNTIAVIAPLSERKGVSYDGCYGYWFGYKAMSEREGPVECDCPAVILDLLSPTDYDWAVDWRSKCRKRASRPNLSRLPKGTTIEFVCPYDTVAYKKGDIVSLTKTLWFNNGGRRTYRWSDGYWYWKQSNMPDDFRIVS